MGLVVDHLHPGLRVTVLQRFADARGRTCQTSDTGILRAMKLDWARQEIVLEWERGSGESERLYFTLQAKTGPRSGHMCSFFHVEDPAPECPLPAPTASASPPVPPTPPELLLPELDLAPHVGSQPPDGTVLQDLAVACPCDPALHRLVLTPPRDLGIHACLGCGTVTCTRTIGDDGRFHGNAWQAFVSVRLPDDVHQWLALWPRIRITRRDEPRWPMAAELVRNESLYFPAATRCASAADLEQVEARLERDTTGLSAGARLRGAGGPDQPPPAGLPPGLGDFRDVWRCLQLRPEAPLPDLLTYAQLRSAASPMAVHLLLQRPDRLDVLLAALRSGDPVRQSAGHALARSLQPVPPELPGALAELLRSLPLEPLPDVPGRVVSCFRMEALLM